MPSNFVGLVLRSVRRDADLSQRELARHADVPATTIAAVEAGRRDAPVTVFAALLTACGWELCVRDRSGQHIDEIYEDGRRDTAGRRYPAHLDVRDTGAYGDWWGDYYQGAYGVPPRPELTFDLSRWTRDRRRRERDPLWVGSATPYGVPVEPLVLQRVAAYAVITDEAGRVLLARLTGVTSRPGWWTLPGGGVEHGEHPRDAVVREVLEETGLSVRVHQLLDVDSERIPPGEQFPDDLHAIRIVYRAFADDPSRPLEHEVGGSTDLAGWFTPQEAATMPLVELAQQGLRLAQRPREPRAAEPHPHS